MFVILIFTLCHLLLFYQPFWTITVIFDLFLNYLYNSFVFSVIFLYFLCLVCYFYNLFNYSLSSVVVLFVFLIFFIIFLIMFCFLYLMLFFVFSCRFLLSFVISVISLFFLLFFCHLFIIFCLFLLFLFLSVMCRHSSYCFIIPVSFLVFSVAVILGHSRHSLLFSNDYVIILLSFCNSICLSLVILCFTV